MDLTRQLVEALPTQEERAKERAEHLRRACAVVARVLAAKAPERLTQETLTALAAGELTTAPTGEVYASRLLKGRGERA